MITKINTTQSQAMLEIKQELKSVNAPQSTQEETTAISSITNHYNKLTRDKGSIQGVPKKGGLVFWAHFEGLNGLKFKSERHPH